MRRTSPPSYGPPPRQLCSLSRFLPSLPHPSPPLLTVPPLPSSLPSLPGQSCDPLQTFHATTPSSFPPSSSARGEKQGRPGAPSHQSIPSHRRHASLPQSANSHRSPASRAASPPTRSRLRAPRRRRRRRHRCRRRRRGWRCQSSPCSVVDASCCRAAVPPASPPTSPRWLSARGRRLVVPPLLPQPPIGPASTERRPLSPPPSSPRPLPPSSLPSWVGPAVPADHRTAVVPAEAERVQSGKRRSSRRLHAPPTSTPTSAPWRDKLGDGLMDACCRSLLVFVMASPPSCLPVPVAITKSYAECHSWFLELTEAMAQIFKLLWQRRITEKLNQMCEQRANQQRTAASRSSALACAPSPSFPYGREIGHSRDPRLRSR